MRSLPDGRAGPADLRRWLREQPRSKLVKRGTPEYLAARDAGVLEPLPALEPAAPEAVAEAEEEIGLPLPSLLRRLYLEVGNGGFGPGQGIPGVRGGADVGWDWSDIAAFHRDARADEQWKAWPWLVPVFDWGCTIMSLFDCRDPDGRMWAWDEGQLISLPHRQTLTEWLGPVAARPAQATRRDRARHPAGLPKRIAPMMSGEFPGQSGAVWVMAAVAEIAPGQGSLQARANGGTRPDCHFRMHYQPDTERATGAQVGGCSRVC